MRIENKSVLVTGADGFIGSHLTEMLILRGAKVKALSMYNSSGHLGWLEDLPDLASVEVVAGDIRDHDLVTKLARGVDIVFHLAALIAIPYSYLAPRSYFQTNVDGTLNVCQSSLDNGVQRVVHVSTSEVYGTARHVPISESHPLQPQSPYSASKIAADAAAAAFFHAFKLPVVIARPFNTYGPRQSARAIIPTVITQILAGKSTIRLGSLHPTRDFNYVHDTCRGIVALAECDQAIGETINLGSNSEISIGDLVRLIGTIMSVSVEVEPDASRVRPSTSEVDRLRCDNAKAQALAGFEPAVDLREGLRRTVDWLRNPENFRRYKADIYNV